MYSEKTISKLSGNQFPVAAKPKKTIKRKSNKKDDDEDYLPENQNEEKQTYIQWNYKEQIKYVEFLITFGRLFDLSLR